ncbi:MAG: YeeE/YedE family protein [Pseudomonadota bacterium]
MNPDWINGLIGGAMIGAAAGLLLLGNGRIAGISGIAGEAVEGLVGRLAEGRGPRWVESLVFVAGLLLAPLAFGAFGGDLIVTFSAALPVLAVAGVLVGLGTRLGSGCTSGHGVCGGARLSRRSVAAMGTFMAAAFVTVAAVNLLS